MKFIGHDMLWRVGGVAGDDRNKDSAVPLEGLTDPINAVHPPSDRRPKEVVIDKLVPATSGHAIGSLGTRQWNIA